MQKSKIVTLDEQNNDINNDNINVSNINVNTDVSIFIAENDLFSEYLVVVSVLHDQRSVEYCQQLYNVCRKINTCLCEETESDIDFFSQSVNIMLRTSKCSWCSSKSVPRTLNSAFVRLVAV